MFIVLEICLKSGILGTWLVPDRFWAGMLFLELGRQQFTSSPADRAGNMRDCTLSPSRKGRT